MGYLRVIYEVTRKDILLESRQKRSLNGSFVFSLLVIVVFSFVFGEQVSDRAVLARGGLWLAVVLGGAVGMSHTVAVEGENSAIEGLLLAPVDRSAVYLGKVASSTVFISIVSLLSLLFVIVFLDFSFTVAVLPRILAVVLLVALGFSAVGVLLSLLLLNSGLQESLLPVLLIPLVIPLLLAGTELTQPALASEPTRTWFQLLVVYDALVLLVGWTTFEYVIEE